jgi:hypothetical protein
VVTRKQAAQDNWLAINRKGFAQVLAQKGRARILAELVSNALDTEAGTVTITFVQGNGRADITVEDDDASGFENLNDSFTLYAPSTRAHDATKRGRNGAGDKEVLAICEWAAVRSTTGTVEFNADGTRMVTKVKRSAGSEFRANLKMNADEAKEFRGLMHQLLVPAGVALWFNGAAIVSRDPLREFQATLGTVLRDDEGNISPTRRKTTVGLYEVGPDEAAHIYELGLPVVEHDSRWHVNIEQKVPLGRDRNNVTPAYLRELREHVLNNSFDLLDTEDSKSRWVRDAYEGASDEALIAVVKQTYGDKAVMADPSDREAVQRCADAGYTVIPSRNPFPAGFGERLRAIGVQPAGQVMPTGIKSDPDGKPPIPEAEWTAGMRQVVAYSQELAFQLFGLKIRVEIFNLPNPAQRWTATWGQPNHLSFNIGLLGKRWFEEPNQGKIDALLIHEFAHRKSPIDHYTERFYDETCRLGALLRDVPLRLSDIGVTP